ncbi:aggregation-promoting factor [Lactiplantibacillus plajomi]|uniref:LysM domain-containing protein n=1 Tax=Lactiplantibacillus plajomi TaxID=1457217 RepID=A0ABV6K291_9LACO|nr:LysM domain-containing protein [Lactiplantibacillus plajomi]
MKIKNALLSTAAATASLFAIGATAQAASVTVKAGDTVSELAETHNTTISAIEKANNLKDVNLIFVGQELELDGNVASTTTATNTTTTTQSNQASTTTQTQQQAPAQHATVAPQRQTSQATTNYNASGSEGAAKAWIAGKESGGSYSARNGQYIGKYQLSASYLNGDYSAANQERVANSYVSSRYGSWSNAKAHWLSNGWY